MDLRSRRSALLPLLIVAAVAAALWTLRPHRTAEPGSAPVRLASNRQLDGPIVRVHQYGCDPGDVGRYCDNRRFLDRVG